MEDIVYEKLNKGPTLNFNETLQAVPKQEIWHTHKQLYNLQCFEKTNSEAVL